MVSLLDFGFDPGRCSWDSLKVSAVAETLRLTTGPHRDQSLAVLQAKMYLSGGNRESTRFAAKQGWWDRNKGHRDSHQLCLPPRLVAEKRRKKLAGSLGVGRPGMHYPQIVIHETMLTAVLVVSWPDVLFGDGKRHYVRGPCRE